MPGPAAPRPVQIVPGDSELITEAVELSPGLRAPARPCEHPLLAGPRHAALRETIERVFDDPYLSHTMGEAIPGLGSQGRVPRLFFVVSGAVRVVHLVRRLRQDGGGGHLWARGRDPHVADLFGPGCFVGLAEAWAHLHGTEPHGLPDLPGVEVRREGYVNPVLSAASEFPYPLLLRSASYEALARIYRDPAQAAFRTWFDQLHALSVVRRKHLLRRLERDPVFEGMGRADQNAVLHNTAWARVCYSCPTSGERVTAAEPLLPRDQPGRRVLMVEAGDVEIQVGPPQTERVVGLHGPGDTVFGAILADEAEDAGCTYPLDAHAGENAEVLVWDRRQVQRVLHRSPAGWARLLEYANPDTVYAGSGIARLTVVVSDEKARDGAVVAAATALALARDNRERGNNEQVRVVDLEGSVAVGRALGLSEAEALRDARPRQGPPITVQGHVPAYAELFGRDLQLPPDGVRVVRPLRIQDVVPLVEALRSQSDLSDVVLHLPAEAAFADALRPSEDVRFERHHTESRRYRDLRPERFRHTCDPRMLLLDGLRGIPHDVIWLNTDPDGWFGITDEVPDRLIRLDQVDQDYIDGARDRMKVFTRWEHEGTTSVDDRAGNTPTHQLRLIADEAQRAEGRTDMPAVLERPDHPLAGLAARLVRMIRRRTVGLALGGGGTWGSAHVAVIGRLEAAGVPVDYVSGTSFGSVVGSVYAGAGMAGLDRLVARCSMEGSTRYLRIARQALRGVRSRLLPQPDWGTRRDVEMVEASWATMLGDVHKLGLLVEQVVRDDARIEHPLSLLETPVPFFAAASNLTTHETYVPHWLPVGLAVRAASGLGPAFPAMRIAGDAMADGAALANVPAQVLRDRGADYVIAVNVVGSPRIDASDQARTGWRWPRATPWVQRLRETWITLWLTIWKAGTDQGALAADAVVDLKVDGVALPSTWDVGRVVTAADDALRDTELGPRIVAHWRGGGRGEGRGPMRIAADVSV